MAGTAQQPCLSAIDKQDEWYDHPCPDCTGHGPASDGKPSRVKITPFHYAASAANSRAYDLAIQNYATLLAKLYFAWIDNHWRGGIARPSSTLMERASITARELACREDGTHRSRDLVRGEFCCCPLTASPLLNNFASQRRFDMALQSSQAHANDRWGWLDGAMNSLTIWKARANVGIEYEALSAWMTTRSPAVLSVVRPFEEDELLEREGQLEELAAVTARRTPDSEIHPSLICIFFVIDNMGELLALDTGLTLPRAKNILRWLGCTMCATKWETLPGEGPDSWLPAQRLALKTGWIKRLARLMVDNWEVFEELCYEPGLDFILDGRNPSAVWGGWNRVITKEDRRKLMDQEWHSHADRYRQRLQNAERNLVDEDPARLSLGATCIICGNDFTSIEAPFDVPAAGHRCVGTHSAAAGRRCLVCFAGKTTNVPSCPICRRPHDENDGEAATST